MADDRESVRLPSSRRTAGDGLFQSILERDGGRRTPEGLLVDAAEERPTPPPRVLVLSLLCLGASLAATSLWPEASQRLAGFVWSLALIPVFLFSYYRGWRGAATAAVGVVAAMVVAVVIRQVVLGRGAEPWIYAVAAAVVAPTALGAGAVTEVLHRKRELSVALAYRDPLTGLANRRLLREHLERMQARADREGGGVGLLTLDLARFRDVNERYGEGTGDRVLRAAGDRLRHRVRDADIVARTGGDEFAVGLTDLETADELAAAAHRLEAIFTDPIHAGDSSVHLKPRIGGARYPTDAIDPDQLLAAAEHARPGSRTPRTIAFSAAEGNGGGERLALAEDLRAADPEREIEPWFQLIYDCGGLQPRAAEALIRWRHPQHGLLSAGKFIDVAEQTGLIRRIDREVFRAAGRLSRDWCSARGLEWIAVNLSPVTLMESADLAGTVSDALDDTGADPADLVIEVPERLVLRDLDVAADALEDLRDLGLGVAVDDFGAGHSSLAYLERFPVDLLKVDMRYLHSLDTSTVGDSLLRGILDLGRGVDALTVAEGVETRDQLNWLEETGRCNFAQGFLLHDPAPPEEAQDAIAGQNGRDRG